MICLLIATTSGSFVVALSPEESKILSIKAAKCPFLNDGAENVYLFLDLVRLHFQTFACEHSKASTFSI